MLTELRSGDRRAFDRLLPIVYGELREIARRTRRRWDTDDDSMNTTALVHEAYLRLAGTSAMAWEDRPHFMCVAARAMRQILLDHARARLAQKRGGGRGPHVTLGDQVAGEGRDEETLIALNDALTQLAQVSERLGRLVELRYFAGLDDAEIAAILGVSVRTVNRDWRTARAFLSRHLQDRG